MPTVTVTSVVHPDGTTITVTSWVDRGSAPLTGTPAAEAAPQTPQDRRAQLKAQIACAPNEHPVVLTAETVLSYCAERLGEINGPVVKGSTLEADDSSTGNLNYCFIVREAEGEKKSMFVKQAPDFVKCLGEDAKLTTDRIRFEAEAALEFMTLAPGCVPELFYYDASNCVMVMEHLRTHILLEDALMSGDVRAGPARGVGRFMAKVHGNTHKDSALATRFDNPALCGITGAYFFTLPFQEDESNSHSSALDTTVAALRADVSFQAHRKAVHDIFLTKKESLLHGDIHAGSIMTDGVDTKVIDQEFAFFGPCGFDLGVFIASYVFPFAAAAARGEAEQMEAIKAAIAAGLQEYWVELAKFGLDMEVTAAIWTDALGFLGCEVLRRVLGVAKRRSVEAIADAAIKLKAEAFAIAFGERCMRGTGRDEKVEKIADAAHLLACLGQLAAGPPLAAV